LFGFAAMMGSTFFEFVVLNIVLKTFFYSFLKLILKTKMMSQLVIFGSFHEFRPKPVLD